MNSPKLPHTESPGSADSETLVAIDVILEALSSALELRDKEEKGHAQRLTEMALRTARAMGINDETLTHIRRGTLLHDIGNLIVPESILYKRGELTSQEWVTIRLHPYYAHEMLQSATLLGSALNIAYCHHEKWDGTGYPRGLKGDRIPLAARIFAVVDVYDALTSDRPYRKAWPPEKALEYIGSQAGTHFDPQVVKVFLESDALRTT